MFKKRSARNLRQKRNDSDEETNLEDTGDTNSRQSENKIEISMSSVSSKQPRTVEVPLNTDKISASASSISLLSFADEDDESSNDVFQVRKSNQSKKLERARRKTKTEEENEPKITSLKFSSTTNKKKNDFESSSKIVITDDDQDSIIILKEEEKRKRAKDQVILTGKDAEAADMASDDAQDLKKRFSVAANEIPDAKLIHLARKQRQMARDAGGPDYIPLDDTQRYRSDTTAAKSRLVREDDDNDASSGEEEGAGAVGAPVGEPRRFYSRLRNENDDERKQTETDFLEVEQGSDDEHDDELDKWEQEQIRKGVSVQQISSYRQEQMASAYYYSQTQSVYGVSGYDYSLMDSQYDSSANGYAETKNVELISSEMIGPQPMDLDIDLHNDEQRLPKVGGGNVNRLAKQFDLNAIRLRIKEKFEEKQAIERSLTSDLEQKSQYIEENIMTIDQLKNCQPTLEQKLQNFQDLRSYIRDILDCLDEKIPIVEKLEVASLNLFYNRSNFFVKRRRQDVKDQFDEISLLSVGKNLDNNDAERMMRSSERDARKARRRQAREKTLTGLGHHEGMSSDDEEAPSRIANFTAEIEKITQEIPAIWSDVEEDYRSTKKIVDRFCEWKKFDRSSYEKCYADLCLPKLLGPIIRSDMITWNLFQADCPLSFEHFQWFKDCMNFDKSFENAINLKQQIIAKNGDTTNDVRLSASVIEKVICPKVKASVEQVWDPLSTTQSERLSTLIKTSISPFLPDKTNPKLKELFESVYKRIKNALDEDLFTPIYSKEVVENKTTGAGNFLEKQFWLALKILKNIGFWDNVMASKIVEELSLDGVINRHIVLNLQCSIYVDVGILTKLKSLTTLITPSQWFQKLKKTDSVNQLEPLYKIMRRICEQIHDSKSLNSNEIYDVQKEICRLMQKLRDTHHNKKLIEKYRLKL